MVSIFLPAQLTFFCDVSGRSPLRLQSHLHRFCGFYLLCTTSEKGYRCYHSKNRLLLFPPDMKKEGIKNRVKHQLKWVLSPHEVYWGTVVPSCPGDGGGCFKLSTGKASFWSSLPGRDWEYWIILLSIALIRPPSGLCLSPESGKMWQFFLTPRSRFIVWAHACLCACVWLIMHVLTCDICDLFAETFSRF